MAIYVYGGPSEEGVLIEELVEFAYASLVNDGISRFFWSYDESFDLNVLTKKSWSELSKEESNARAKAEFLLQIKPGDYVVHVNVPQWGEVTAGEVVEGYFFQKDLPAGQTDGRHCLKVKDVFTFNRNDSRVHPMVSRRLKPRSSHWQMYCEEEFFDSLARLKTESEAAESFFVKEANEVFSEFAKKIHRNYPGKSLESFIAKVFNNVPGVLAVKENGSGFKSDYGADLIVSYKNGIADFGSEELMVVQIKSYEGEIWNTQAADQIRTALSYFDASSGLIITTAKSTEAIEKAVSSLSQETGKPVYVLAGEDLARFVLTYGMDLI